MNQLVRDWIVALRSGKYRQTKGRLHEPSLLSAITAYKSKERCCRLSESEWRLLEALKTEAFRRGLRY